MLAAGALACTSAPPPAPRTSLAVGIVGEPRSLLASDRVSRFLGALAIEELVRPDAKDELEARLAREVPNFDNGGARIVADERTPAGRLAVTFRLREGLVWHDGAPITSEDVVFAWQRDLAAPAGGHARADALMVERVDVVDVRTVTFVLRPGLRTNRYPLLAHVMPRHLLGGAAAETTAAYARKPVHAGPFTLASWQNGSGATFTAFGRYALGAPKLTRIEVRFYPDQDALVAALAKGEVELAPADALTADFGPQLERFAESRGLVVRYTPQEWADTLLFDLRRAYADVRVRRAVIAAVDRRAINAQVFAGRARLPTSYLFAPSWAATEPSPPDVGTEAARAGLASAGYCAAPRCAGAPTLRARILVESGSRPRVAAAELVARDLAAMGAVTTVILFDASAFRSALAGGDFDLAITSRGGADPAEATDEYIGGSAANVTGYADAAFDVLARSAASFLTRSERRPLYTELQRIWTAAAPALPLYQELAVDVVPASLEGVAPSALHQPLSWNAHAWRHSAP